MEIVWRLEGKGDRRMSRQGRDKCPAAIKFRLYDKWILPFYKWDFPFVFSFRHR